jgi:hypothetical protein
MTIADGFLNSGDLEKCRYWTERANRAAERAGFPGWDTPASLGMRDVIQTALREGLPCSNGEHDPFASTRKQNICG